MKKEKDNTNYSRLFELKGKIVCPELQHHTAFIQQINLNPDNQRVIDKYVPKESDKLSQPIDNK